MEKEQKGKSRQFLETSKRSGKAELREEVDRFWDFENAARDHERKEKSTLFFYDDDDDDDFRDPPFQKDGNQKSSGVSSGGEFKSTNKKSQPKRRKVVEGQRQKSRQNLETINRIQKRKRYDSSDNDDEGKSQAETAEWKTEDESNSRSQNLDSSTLFSDDEIEQDADSGAEDKDDLQEESLSTKSNKRWDFSKGFTSGMTERELLDEEARQDDPLWFYNTIVCDDVFKAAVEGIDIDKKNAWFKEESCQTLDAYESCSDENRLKQDILPVAGEHNIEIDTFRNYFDRYSSDAEEIIGSQDLGSHDESDSPELWETEEDFSDSDNKGSNTAKKSTETSKPTTSKPEILECPNCDYKTDRKDLLRRHKNKVNTKCAQGLLKKDKGKRKKFICYKCQSEFSLKKRLVAHQKAEKCKKRQKLTIEDLSCQHCGYTFRRAKSLQQHLDYRTKYGHCPSYRLDNGLYYCRFCKEGFKTDYDVRQHEFKKCKSNVYTPETGLTYNQKIQKHPLSFNGFGLREEVARGLDTVDVEACWLLDWTLIYMKNLSKISRNKRRYVVYIAAVLGPLFKPAAGIREFMKTNPNQILGIYCGSDSHNSDTKLIHQHHFDHPESSSLALAAAQGNSIVVLKREKFTGELPEKSKDMKSREAELIELMMTDAEYEPVAGVHQYRIMNQRRENLAMRHCSRESLSDMYRKAVTGINLLCLDNSCNNCDAVIHPDWTDNMLVDFSQVVTKIPAAKVNSPDAGNLIKKTRPSSTVKINGAIEKRIKQFTTAVSAHDDRHYLYTVIVPSKSDYPHTTATEICRQILERKEEDLTIPIYVGVNAGPRSSDHHSLIPQRSSIGKLLLRDNDRVAITIAVEEFETRNLARQAEALTLLQLFIEKRIKKLGVKFDIINEHMEWSSLELCSEIQILERIKRGLLGIPTISLDGPKPHQIDFRSQIQRERVKVDIVPVRE